MKTMTLLVLIASFACGGQSGPSETTPDTGSREGEIPDDVADRIYAFASAIMDTIISNSGKCDDMGIALNKLFDANAAAFAESRQYHGRKLPQRILDQRNRRARSVLDAVRPCWEHEGYESAMRRLRAQTELP